MTALQEWKEQVASMSALAKQGERIIEIVEYTVQQLENAGVSSVVRRGPRGVMLDLRIVLPAALQMSGEESPADENILPSRVDHKLAEKSPAIASFISSPKSQKSDTARDKPPLPKDGPAPAARQAPQKAAKAANAAAQAAPPATGAATPSLAHDTSLLSADEREIYAHLNALGYVGAWTAKRDFALVQGMARGDGAAAVAKALGKTKETIITRWRALNMNPTSIDHQTRLIRVLKLRADT